MALVGDADGRFRAQPTVQMVDFTKLVWEIELVGEHSIPRAQLPRLPRQGLEHGVLLQRACQRRALRLGHLGAHFAPKGSRLRKLMVAP